MRRIRTRDVRGRPTMNLTVFGPTGSMGEQIVRQALAAATR